MIIIEADVGKTRSGLDKLKDVLESQVQARLEVAGHLLENEMLHKIDAGLSPALKKATIKRRIKQSDVPLYNTEELYDQISHEVKDNAVDVGVFGSRAQIAKYHEFGAPKAGIPERSFMRSAFNENKGKIKKIVSGKL